MWVIEMTIYSYFLCERERERERKEVKKCIAQNVCEFFEINV